MPVKGASASPAGEAGLRAKKKVKGWIIDLRSGRGMWLHSQDTRKKQTGDRKIWTAAPRRKKTSKKKTGVTQGDRIARRARE